MLDKNDKREYLRYALIISFIIFIRLFVIDIVRVEGRSMYPTLNENGDRVLLEKDFISNKYQRGDVVVVDLGNKSIIKRVIGLPNEKLEIKDGKVYINNEELSEQYLDENIKTTDNLKVNIPEGYIFVLGDNRPNSLDSRQIGCIDLKDVKGKTLYRYNILKGLFNKI